MDEDEPVLNHGGVVFGMVGGNLTEVIEKLKHFGLNSARAKKIFDKYFKKGASAETWVRIPLFRMHQVNLRMQLLKLSSRPIER